MNGLRVYRLLTAAVIYSLAGCGTTKLQEATEQLVLSSAVDRSIAMIDFRPLAGQKVYLDTTYMQAGPPTSYVNMNYVISAMRQQIMASGCMLQEERDKADIVIEGRLGTLGADDHRVTYGIPENNGLSTAASIVARTPAPSVPEVAIARRDAREGAAKVAAFAYDRVTRTPVWQSGISQSIATSRNTWVLGIGPFQGGSIREGTHLAKGQSKSGRTRPGASPQELYDRPVVEHTAEVRFDHGWPVVSRSRGDGALVGSGLPIGPLKLPLPVKIDSGPLAPDEAIDSPESVVAEEPGLMEDDTILR